MMGRALHIPDASEITDETPLRLDVAAALAYPGGGMTASGLRTEKARGRLAVERVAGRDWTTLGAIARMRELCRVNANPPDSGFDLSGSGAARSRHERPGSSSTEASSTPQDALRAILQQPNALSQSTTSPSIPRRGRFGTSKQSRSRTC